MPRIDRGIFVNNAHANGAIGYLWDHIFNGDRIGGILSGNLNALVLKSLHDIIYVEG